MIISRKFKAAIKLGEIPAYKVAQQADLSPCTLSHIINGITKVKPHDPRVLRVAKVLDLRPEECFEDEVGLKR